MRATARHAPWCPCTAVTPRGRICRAPVTHTSHSCVRSHCSGRCRRRQTAPSARSALEQCSHRAIELWHVERLAVIGTCSRPDETRPLARIVVVRQNDDRSFIGEHTEAKVCHEVPTVDIGQDGVEDDDAWSGLRGHLQPRVTAVGDNELQALPAARNSGEADAALGVAAYVEQRSFTAKPRCRMPSSTSPNRLGRSWRRVEQAEARARILGSLGPHASKHIDRR